MFDGGRDALRDRWDASERDSELLWLATGDDLGDDNGAKRFNAAAAAISRSLKFTRLHHLDVCMYVCMYICFIMAMHRLTWVWAVTER